MSNEFKLSPNEQELMTELWSPGISDNPLNFVMYAFPWGKKGTPLEKFPHPRTWQTEELVAINEYLLECAFCIDHGLPLPPMYQSATASGRGIGKSALVAWLVLWMMSTRIGSTSIVTANTESQLKSRTWAELGKWHTLSINAHWWDRTALSLRPASWFEQLVKKQLKIDTGYYYAQAQLWSEENPDAFAGVHNHYGVLLVMDESSGIPKPIWTVSSGFFTEPIPNRFWLTFSNPRRNTGEFYECFNANGKFWRHRNIDSRDVEGTDKHILNQIVEQHGEDSDEAKIEVKGRFPSQSDRQFISREAVDGAVLRDIPYDSQNPNYEPLIMGVDPARFGNDATVIYFRQGRDARSIPPIIIKKMDNMYVANECARLIDKYNPDAVAIDIGNGAGVVDRLRELKYVVSEIAFGGKADDETWANKRTEIWARMREWLKGGCIGAGDGLKNDLVSPEYNFFGKTDKQILESKEEMKKRGLKSPDVGDALALTFAVKPARRHLHTSRNNPVRQSRTVKDVDYDLYSH